MKKVNFSMVYSCAKYKKSLIFDHEHIEIICKRLTYFDKCWLIELLNMTEVRRNFMGANWDHAQKHILAPSTFKSICFCTMDILDNGFGLA